MEVLNVIDFGPLCILKYLHSKTLKMYFIILLSRIRLISIQFNAWYYSIVFLFKNMFHFVRLFVRLMQIWKKTSKVKIVL